MNLIQNSVQLYLRTVPHYPPKHYPPKREILWMGKNPTQQSKIYSFPQPEKFLLINFLLQKSKVSFLCSSNSNFHLITLYNLHLWLYPLLLYHFLTSGFVYTCVMLTLINWCLSNVVFTMTKALNGQSSPEQNFYSSHLSMLIEKPCFSLGLFSFSFRTPFSLFQTL